MLNDFGNEIHSATGYKGWLQVDLIESGGELWLLEANPRWSAGMEILALTGLSPVEAHSECFRVETSKPGTCTTTAKPTACKATYYAESDLTLSEGLIRKLEDLSKDNFCDIPARNQAGSPINKGQPVLTIRTLSAGTYIDRPAMLRQLQKYREQVDSILA